MSEFKNMRTDFSCHLQF